MRTFLMIILISGSAIADYTEQQMSDFRNQVNQMNLQEQNRQILEKLDNLSGNKSHG